MVAVNEVPPSKIGETSIVCPWCKGSVVVDIDARDNGRADDGGMRVALTGKVRPHACPYRRPDRRQ